MFKFKNTMALGALALCGLGAVQTRSAHGMLFMTGDREEPQRVVATLPPNQQMIRPPTPIPPPQNNGEFRVTDSRVDVRIDENIATTTIEQSFRNLTGRNLEVRVLIPLPRGATINKSSLSMNDDMVEGKLYNALEAQSIYERIVAQRRDPFLLKYAGENLYEARVFPIPPNQERKMRFSYDMILEPSAGLFNFRHILTDTDLYKQTPEKFQFECVIRSKKTIGPVYSPSHNVIIERPDNNTAIVKMDSRHWARGKDFQLFYSPSTEDVNLRMVTHRASEKEDGYFMLLGRPGDQVDKAKILPKELVMVLDISGSMAGEKIEQAKNALRFVLNQLNEHDRFNMITFSTNVNFPLGEKQLLDANKANVQKALKAVDEIEATGGTNIDSALRSALMYDFTDGPTKSKSVVFMTDGKPSVGVTDSQSILEDARQSNNKPKARVFVFGVGTDLNTNLLDRLANDGDGTGSYIVPGEDIEVKVGDFYSKIKNPVMTNVELALGDEVRVNSMYPKKIPALFKGSEILLFGRYRGSGPGVITLKGNLGGEAREIKLNVNWPEAERDNSYLPRVWATRKIGHLLEDIRLNGSNQETIDEIVNLSQKHGIVTPYTSQLVLEPGMDGQNIPQPPGTWRGGPQPVAATAPAAMERDFGRVREEMKKEAKEKAEFAMQQTGGLNAVGLAEAEKRFKQATLSTDAEVASAKPMEQTRTNSKADDAKEAADRAVALGFISGDKDPRGEGGGKGGDEAIRRLSDAQALTIKAVGARTFYLRGGVWVDSTFGADGKSMTPEKIAAYSEKYFEMLKKNPALGEIFALGGQIIWIDNGQAYQVVTE